MDFYRTNKVAVRISPDEAKIIDMVEQAKSAIPHHILKQYRLLMDGIRRVAEWKARNERTKT